MDSVYRFYVKISHLELVYDVISTKQFTADESEGVAIADVIQREHVKRPIIDFLP